MARGEIPEYKRKSGIQPEHNKVGFVQSAQEFNQSAENLAQSQQTLSTGKAQLNLAREQEQEHKLVAPQAFANTLMTLSNQAAIEQAKIAGAEAATKRPGAREFLVLNETDATFKQAYQTEEFNAAKFEANNYLSKIYQTAASDPNPNAKTLELYQQNAAKQLSMFAEQVAPQYQKDFHREIMSVYQTNYSQIAKRVQDNNRRYLEGAHAAQDMQLSQDITNYNIDGYTEAASQKFQERLGLIESRAKIEGWTDDQVKKAEDAAIAEYQTSLRQGEWKEKREGEDGEKAASDWMADQVKNPPANMTPIQNMQSLEGVRAYAQQYNAALSGQQQLAYISAKSEVANGTMTPAKLERAKEQMSVEQAARIDIDIAKANAKREKKTTDSMFIDNHLDNPAVLASVNTKDINAWFQDRVQQLESNTGQPASMESRAKIAETVQREVPAFVDQVSALARSGNPKNIADASRAYNYLAQNNPLSVNGVPAQVAKALKNYSDGIKGGMMEKDLIPLVNEALKPVPEQEYSQRVDNYKNVRKELGWNNPQKQKKDIATDTDTPVDAVSDGMMYAYNQDFELFYLQTGDAELAKQKAAIAINSTYSDEQELNGRPQKMFAGPSKFYNLAGEGIGWFKAQSFIKAKELFAKSKEAFDAGHTSWYYEMESRPVEEQQIKELTKRGQFIEKLSHFGENERITVKKIYADGSSTEGYLELNSDNATAMPEEGTRPSYGYYLANKKTGRLESINIPGSVAGARFAPDEAPALKHYKERNDRYVDFIRENSFKRRILGMEGGIRRKKEEVSK